MKLIELLENPLNQFDGELVTDEWETPFSFVWDGDFSFTSEGKEKFNLILNSEASIEKNNIVIHNNAITEEQLTRFTAAMAGYCSVTEWDRWMVQK